MSIISIDTSQTGQVGVLPSFASINTSDPIATVTTTGYLNKEIAAGITFSLPCIAKVSTMETPASQPIVNWYHVLHSGSDWSLSAAGGGGGGDFVKLSPTGDQVITDDNLQLAKGTFIAGSNGNGGAFKSFNGVGTGSVTFGAIEGISIYDLFVGNAPYGQDTSLYIADPGNVEGVILSAPTAAPFVNGNFPMNSGTRGKMVDSGISVSEISAGLSPLNKVIYVDMIITAADLEAEQQVYVVPPVDGQSFIIRGLMFNVAAGFAGGDRGIFLQDGSSAYASIDSSLIMSPVNTAWGGTGLDFGGNPTNRPTDVGGGFWFDYFAGTSDYTSGTINVTVAYERIS